MWMIKDRETDKVLKKNFQSRHEAQSHANLLEAADGSSPTYVKWYDETTVQEQGNSGLVFSSGRKKKR